MARKRRVLLPISQIIPVSKAGDDQEMLRSALENAIPEWVSSMSARRVNFRVSRREARIPACAFQSR